MTRSLLAASRCKLCKAPIQSHMLQRQLNLYSMHVTSPACLVQMHHEGCLKDAAYSTGETGDTWHWQDPNCKVLRLEEVMHHMVSLISRTTPYLHAEGTLAAKQF